MDCVQSWSVFFLWKVSYPVLISLLFFLWIVSNPGHGTRIARGLDWYTDIGYCSLGLLVDIPLLSAAGIILVTAPKLQEDGIGTQSDQHKFMSIKSMSLLKPGATRCHGTRIARGVPLPVYMNLDLYSGFWCTSRCVVF